MVSRYESDSRSEGRSSQSPPRRISIVDRSVSYQSVISCQPRLLGQGRQMPKPNRHFATPRPRRRKANPCRNSSSCATVLARAAVSDRTGNSSAGSSASALVPIPEQGAEMLHLQRAEDVPQHRPERDHPTLAGEPGIGQHGQYRFTPAQRADRAVSVDQQQRHNARMRGHRDPHPVGQHREFPAGRGARQADVDGSQHQVHHQLLELVAVGHVAIEGHRADSELSGDRSHGERIQAVAVDDGQCGRSDLVRGQ